MLLEFSMNDFSDYQVKNQKLQHLKQLVHY